MEMEKDVKKATSPVPAKKADDKVQISFYQALKALANGGKITKLDWENDNIYGLLHNGLVSLHKDDDKIYTWLVSDGDLDGKDWIILDEK